jgi:PAS domain S-box-containing protein
MGDGRRHDGKNGALTAVIFASKDMMRDYRQVQQILAGLAEGAILIDLKQRILWANEAALAMHGVTRLTDLGTTIEEYRQRFRLRYRNNHPLNRGDHPIERVIAGEASSDATIEVSHLNDPEQCWIHAIRCFVITDERDKPDYLILIIEDETERFEAEERFERAFNANPAPAIICRLSDLRYVRANPGFLEMTGYAREDVIGRSAYEIDVLAEAEMRDLALERLKEGRPIPQMEACLALPGGVRKLVIVAGQPIEIQDASCMLFTFADLDPRRKAETALRQSEERFAKSFRLSPVPATICMLDGLKVIEANEAYTKITGYAEEESVGRSSAELGVWPDRATRERFKQAIDKEGSVRNFDIQLRTKDGAVFDCSLSAEAVTINDQPCVLCVMQDITERKRSENELIAAIEAVMADTSWFSRSIVEKLAALRQTSGSASPSADLNDLTERERDILGLICEGQSDHEMSDTLRLSRNTIRNHVSSLYRKIGVNRRSAAIIWARERGVTGQDALRSRKSPKKVKKYHLT